MYVGNYYRYPDKDFFSGRIYNVALVLKSLEIPILSHMVPQQNMKQIYQ